MKKLFILLSLMIPCVGFAADAETPTASPRVSLFSTSTDWAALTQMPLNQYRVEFVHDAKVIGKKGMVLYYLDGFPCYGLAYAVRTWLSPKNNHDGDIQLACVYAPREVKFAWRHATRDADQAPSTGLMTCPVVGDRTLTVNLSKCDVQTGWGNH